MSIFERRQQSAALKRFSVTSTTSSASCLTSLRDNDVVKRGCLHVKRPPSNSAVKLRIKAWQKRYLVLRDAWTPDGETTLELHDTAPTSSLITSTVSFSSIDDISSVGVDHRPTGSRGRRHYVINLRTVMYVDVYQESESFPNAFIVFRTGKSPLIFGAKTDLEMREWMMAIKLLADKLRTRSSVRDATSSTASSIIGSHRQRQRQPDPTTATGESTPPITARRRSDLPLFAMPGTTTTTTTTRSASREDVMRRSTPQLMTSSPSGCSPKMQQQATSASSRVTDKLFPVRMQHYVDPRLTRRLHGEFILAVGDVDISLRHSRPNRSTDDVFNDTDDVIVRWLLQDIRKLKCESCDDGFGDVITLVAMSNSPTLDGATYQFRTGCGLNVIRCVRKLVRKLDPNVMATTRSRDDLTSVGGNMAATSTNVGSKRLVTSTTSTSKSSVVSTWSTTGSAELLTAVRRSQPNLLNSPDQDYIDNGTSGCHSSTEGIPPTKDESDRGDSDGGAFYLPLIDDGHEDFAPVCDEINEDRVKCLLSAPTRRQVILSKSTGALDSTGTRGAGDSHHNNNNIIGSGWISPGAPRPPPRPIHTIPSSDVLP